MATQCREATQAHALPSSSPRSGLCTTLTLHASMVQHPLPPSRHDNATFTHCHALTSLHVVGQAQQSQQ